MWTAVRLAPGTAGLQIVDNASAGPWPAKVLYKSGYYISKNKEISGRQKAWSKEACWGGADAAPLPAQAQTDCGSEARC